MTSSRSSCANGSFPTPSWTRSSRRASRARRRGDYRFAGDDVENIIWTLRALGTRNEWEALQVEDAIRILAGVEDGGYSFKRQPGLRVFDRCALYALRAARRAVPSLAV